MYGMVGCWGAARHACWQATQRSGPAGHWHSCSADCAVEVSDSLRNVRSAKQHQQELQQQLLLQHPYRGKFI